MSTMPLSLRKANFVSPPRVNGTTGNVAAITVSAVASSLDLRTLSRGASATQGQYNSAQTQQGFQGAMDQYITILADGADLYVVFGPSQASVTGANAPVAATVGSVSGAGAYTDAAGTAWKIPNGQSLRVMPQLNQDAFMGFVGSAAGTMRLFQSSPPNA